MWVRALCSALLTTDHPDRAVAAGDGIASGAITLIVAMENVLVHADSGLADPGGADGVRRGYA